MSQEKHQKSLKTIAFLSNWMDTKFTIPGTNIKFGIDAMLSLIPGFGDLASTGISIGIFGMILRKGGPFGTALKMMFNILIDAAFSSVPFLGTIVDIGFKSNTRNLKLLEDHLTTNPDEKYAYGIWMVFGLTIVLAFALIGVLAVLLWKIVASIF